MGRLATAKAIHIAKSLEKPFARPKLVNKYVFANAFLPTLKTIFFGNSSSSIEWILNCNELIMNEHQQLTRGIKHWGLGCYVNILPRIKFGVTGQKSSPQSPTISYRHRCAACKETFC